MLLNDAYLSRLQLTITALRYWAPSIANAARVTESETPQYWRLTVVPELALACPFEFVLRVDQSYDIAIAGEEYENRPVASLDLFPQIAEAIARGNVFQRRWRSTATGVLRAVETIVAPDGGHLWRGAKADTAAVLLTDGVASCDHYFLPYQR